MNRQYEPSTNHWSSVGDVAGSLLFLWASLRKVPLTNYNLDATWITWYSCRRVSPHHVLDPLRQRFGWHLVWSRRPQRKNQRKAREGRFSKGIFTDMYLYVFNMYLWENWNVLRPRYSPSAKVFHGQVTSKSLWFLTMTGMNAWSPCRLIRWMTLVGTFLWFRYLNRYIR